MTRPVVMYSVCRIGHLAVALLWLVAPIAVPASTLPETYGGHQAQLPLIFKEHPHHHHQPQEFPDISSSSITTKDDDVAAIVPADHGAVSSSPSALYTASYDEQQVVRIDISSLPGRQVENLLEELESADFDLWQRRKNEYIDVRVPANYLQISPFLSISHLTTVIIPSLHDHISMERTRQHAALSALALKSHTSLMEDPTGGLHSLYHPYPAIESLLKLFSNDFPEFTKLENIGKSAEGRHLWSLKISDYRPKHKDKHQSTWRELSRKAILALKDGSLSGTRQKEQKTKHRKLGFAILGGQHAREWISPASMLYLAHSLLSTAQNSKSAREQTDQAEQIMTLLAEYELHFIPVANPDGYQYAWDHDRLWVRSRQHISHNDTRCHGIDLNRNWAYKFDKPYRPNPCSDLYPGLSPFESVELQAISEYLTDTKKHSRMDVFLDIHSFGQMIMYPYSYSCDIIPPDAENLFEALLRASKAIHEVHKQSYEVGGVCDVSYTATGQSLDWTYHELKAKWSFAANLRDQGVHAFLLPPEYIVPTGQELLAGLLDLAKFIAQKEKIED